MDPAYKPAAIETRQVYGIHMQQKRNDAKIDAKLFENIVTTNKEVHGFRFVCIYNLLTPSSAAAFPSFDGSHRRDSRLEVHAI